MEYYSALKKGGCTAIGRNRGEQEDIVPSEISQSWRDLPCRSHLDSKAVRLMEAKLEQWLPGAGGGELGDAGLRV